VPIVLKSESLKLLETYRPVQDYNGIVLPFTMAHFKNDYETKVNIYLHVLELTQDVRYVARI
jgi:hypothetical protein